MVAGTSNIVRLTVDRTGDDDVVEYESLEFGEVELKLHRLQPNRDEAVTEMDVFGEELLFFDADGVERGNLRQVLETAAMRSSAPVGETFEQQKRFREPTYIRIESGQLARLSSIKFTACSRRDRAFGELLVHFLHEITAPEHDA